MLKEICELNSKTYGEKYFKFFLSLFISIIYTQHRAGTHDLKIRSRKLFRLNQPGVPQMGFLMIFKLKHFSVYESLITIIIS